MAMENAAHAFQEKRRAQQDVEARLGRIQERLGLPRLPHRIECVDVSHTGGEDTVAAITALNDGEPERKRYRSFHVQGVQPADDYGAMYQVLARRFRRGRNAERGWELPDLLVVDGGKGQLGVAQAALRDLEVDDFPVVALAKEKEDVRGETMVDRVYIPGAKNAIPLRSSPALSMLALVRDEAHRASNALRLKKGKRRQLRSDLDSIEGIGAKTRNKLLHELGSLQAVTEATEQQIVEAGATRKQARAIREAFHGPSPGSADSDPGSDDQQQDASSESHTAEAEEVALDNAFETAADG
jgi:excinuclease ABC subunit C